MKKLTLLIIAMLPLVGCQQIAQQKHEYIRNRSYDYLTSGVIAPLEIPPDLSHPTPTENFPVPERLSPLGRLAKVSLVPPGFGIMSEPTS